MGSHNSWEPAVGYNKDDHSSKFGHTRISHFDNSNSARALQSKTPGFNVAAFPPPRFPVPLLPPPPFGLPVPSIPKEFFPLTVLGNINLPYGGYVFRFPPPPQSVQDLLAFFPKVYQPGIVELPYGGFVVPFPRPLDEPEVFPLLITGQVNLPYGGSVVQFSHPSLPPSLIPEARLAGNIRLPYGGFVVPISPPPQIQTFELRDVSITIYTSQKAHATLIYDQDGIPFHPIPGISYKGSEVASPEEMALQNRSLVLPVPSPTKNYLALSSRAPGSRLVFPQPLLVILDLNGTLLFRSKGNLKNFQVRDDALAFIAYLMQTHLVMVWSSAKPENVSAMCSKLFNHEQRQHLIAEWGRDTLGLSPHQYNNKVQVYKQLRWVWRSEQIQIKHPYADQGYTWNQTNTVLLDDSALKAVAEPHNLVQVPEYLGPNKPDVFLTGSVLSQVAGYLEWARVQPDVSSAFKYWPFMVDCGWKYELDKFREQEQIKEGQNKA